jgi:hypothetical protein
VRDVVGDVELQYVPGRTGDYAGAPVCGERAAAELGWRATTTFAEGVRRYVAWLQDAAPAPVPATDRSGSLAALARRSALALAYAVVTAVLVIGVAVLTPLEGNLDPYDTFFGALVLLLPLALAGGFSWEEPMAGRLRAALWATAIACLAVALTPWPSFLDHGHHHAVLLVLLAVAAGGAVRLVGVRLPLPAWLGASSG